MKKVSRRYLLTVLLAFVSPISMGQNFPGTQPIRLIVPANSGGTNDIIARAVQPHLSQALGVPVVVENKVGAGGRVGAQEVVRAAPDGRTLLMSASHIQVTQKWVYRTMPYDPEKDLIPVSMVGLSSNVLLVNSSLPIKSVAELIDYAKKHPGKLNYASVGVGTSSHLGAELFKSVAGIDITHIPYNGSAPALKDLIGGEVSMQFENMPTALPHIPSGRVRPLAVTTRVRSPLLPDVPTLSEAGLKDFEAAPWYCFSLPAGVPRAIMDRWHKELEAALAKPDVVALLNRTGIQRLAMSQEEILAFQNAEHKKWKVIVEKSGATVD